MMGKYGFCNGGGEEMDGGCGWGKEGGFGGMIDFIEGFFLIIFSLVGR